MVGFVMFYDVIILGAGPAGLFATLRLSEAGLKVLLLEKKGKPGRKLLLSGSGQCNLTNAASLESFLNRYGEHGRFLKPALHHFSPTALTDFCQAQGLSLEETATGKIFPASRKAGDLLNLLLDGLYRAHGELLCSRAATSIEHESSTFVVETSSPESSGTERFEGRNLIICAGGSSYPVTGSSGDGGALAKSLGHSIVEARPSLTPVYPEPWDFGSCAGLSLSGATIGLWREGKKIREYSGDVLFTHKGLSGPGILDASRDFRKADELRVRLTDREGDASKLDAELQDEVSRSPKKAVKNILALFGLSESLALAVLKRCSVAEETTASVLGREERRRLARALEGLCFTIGRIGSWEEAMATAGGVELSEVNAKTMESRLVPGLYFAGEVLDIDGDSGGFNIQAAFSTAALASSDIVRKLKPKMNIQ